MRSLSILTMKNNLVRCFRVRASAARRMCTNKRGKSISACCSIRVQIFMPCMFLLVQIHAFDHCCCCCCPCATDVAVRSHTYSHLVLAVRSLRDECIAASSSSFTSSSPSIERTCAWWLARAPFALDAGVLRVASTLGLADGNTHAAALEFFAALLQHNAPGAGAHFDI